MREGWTQSVWGRVEQLLANQLAQAEPARRTRRRKQVQVRLNAVQVEALVAHYLDGSSIRALARKFHVDGGTARRHLLASGVALRPMRTCIPSRSRPTPAHCAPRAGPKEEVSGYETVI